MSASLIRCFRPDSFYTSWKHVLVAPGDFLISRLGLSSISVIKIDVEGGELEVIEGLRSSIGEYEPFILFEVLPHYLAVTDEGLDEKTIEFRTKRIRKLESILREKGYTIFQVSHGRILNKINRINPVVGPDLSRGNYLAIPGSKENEFLELFK